MRPPPDHPIRPHAGLTPFFLIAVVDYDGSIQSTVHFHGSPGMAFYEGL